MKGKLLRALSSLCLIFAFILGGTVFFTQASLSGEEDHPDDVQVESAAEETDESDVEPPGDADEKNEIISEEEDSGKLVIEKMDEPAKPEDISDRTDDEIVTESEPMVAAALTNIGTGADFVKAFNGLQDGAIVDIQLTSNITVTSTIKILHNITVNIKGNYTITVSGTTDLFHISASDTTFNLNGVTMNGGGFYLSAGTPKFVLKGIDAAIKNAAPAVNAISDTVTADIEIDGMKFEANKGCTFTVEHSFGSSPLKTIHGGALAVWAGKLQITNSIFDNNEAYFMGGAAYLGAAATTITNCFFTGNTATVGGAVYSPDGALTIEGSTFKNNRTSDSKMSGAWKSYGGAICTGTGALKITGSEFDSNKALGGKDNSDGYGGVLRVDTGSVHISKTTFKKNEAAWGGVIYSYNGPIKLEECTAESNAAVPVVSNYSCGGGVVSMVYSTLEATGGTYKYNAARGSYGSGGVFKLYYEGGTPFISISGGTYEGNSASTTGGVIDSMGKGKVTVAGNAAIINNAAVSAGGALYTCGELKVTDSTIKDNKVTKGSGGGVYMESGNASLVNSLIAANEVSASGGGIFIASGSLTVTGTTNIDGNTAKASGEVTGGGGIYLNSGGLVVESGNIYGNGTEGSGGGIAAYNGTVTMKNGSIYSNQANGNGGGGVAIYSAGFTMSGGTIGGADNKANTAANNGGGIYNIYGVLKVTGGTVSYNRALNGGGIFVSGRASDGAGLFDLSKLTVSNNTATTDGGGIYANVTNASSVMKDMTISDNKASGDGGGVHISFNNKNAAADWSGNQVLNNTGGDGAGLYIHGTGSLTMSNGQITDNKAVGSGGGIYNKIKLSLNNMGITANQANGISGGGVMITGEGAQLNVSDSTITANQAQAYGGGIFIFDQAVVSLNNKTVVGISGDKYNGGVPSDTSDMNKAGMSGGGVYLSTGTLNITGTSTNKIQVNGNKAENGSGGGIFIRNGALNMKQAQINGNTAAENGGGIYLVLADPDSGTSRNPVEPQSGTKMRASGEGVIQNLDDNEMTYNKAGMSGGGAYVHINKGGVSNSIVGNKLAYNEARDGGGVYLNYEGTGERILNNEFLGNKAARNGGGLYITGKGEESTAEHTKNRMSLSTDLVSENEAGNNGGGIYLYNSDLVLLNIYDKYGAGYETMERGPEITNNNALNGGGIYAVGTSQIEIWRQTKIQKNTAKVNGGGINLDPTCTLSFDAYTDSIYNKHKNTEDKKWIYITGNRAGYGGGIYGIGTGLDVRHTILTGNTAHTADNKGDGGGIWLQHSRLDELFINNVMFVYGGKANTADRYFPIAGNDVPTYTNNINTTSGFSVDNRTPGIYDDKPNAYNNYDIAYNAEQHTVIFSGNGGEIIEADNSRADIKAKVYTKGANIPELDIPKNEVLEHNDAVFIGWFRGPEIDNYGLLDNINTDLSQDKYTSALQSTEKIKKTVVEDDIAYFAGWLFAPTINDIYESDVYRADNTIFGSDSPGAVVTVRYEDENGTVHTAKDNIHTDNTWNVKLENAVLKEGRMITATQSYEEQYSIESPEAEAVILAGYTLTYRPGYGANTQSEKHKIIEKGITYEKYMASETLKLYGEGTFIREGYRFAGWSLGSGASQEMFGAGEELLLSNVLENELISGNNITLYGVWDKMEYTVTYEPGEVSDAKVPVDKGTYEVDERVIFEKMEQNIYGDYYFTGWKLDDGTMYNPGQSYTFSGKNARHIVLTAQWAAGPNITVSKESNPEGSIQIGETLTYTITVKNSGKGSWQSGKITDELPKELSFGYVSSNLDIRIDGKKVDNIHGAIDYNDAKGYYELTLSNIMLEGGQTLTASFDTTVSMDAAGSSFRNTVVVSGKDGGGNKHEDEDTTDEMKVPKLTVTYDGNVEGITGVPVDSNGYKYKDAVTVKDENKMEYNGHYFAGWSTNKNYAADASTGAFYRPGDTFDIEKNTILYAVWYKNPTIDLELVKKDAHDENILLSGAEFEVKKLIDGSAADETGWVWETFEFYKTNARGSTFIKGLEEGTYRGYETTPPEGYEYPIGNSNYITFEITAVQEPDTGVKTLNAAFPSLKYVDGQQTENGWVESVSAEGTVITALNREASKPYANIEIEKVDEYGTALADAQFTLYRWGTDSHTGKEDWQLVGGSHNGSGKNNHLFTWKAIKEGRYQLRETKTPAGYMAAASEYLEFELIEKSAHYEMKIIGEIPYGIKINADGATSNEVTTFAGEIQNIKAVELDKSTEIKKAYIGEEFTYDITIDNTGQETWNGTLTDKLPDGLEYVSCDVNDGADVDIVHQDGIVTFTINSLKAKEKIAVTLVVKANAAGTYVNSISGSVQNERGIEIDISDGSDKTIVGVLPVLEKSVTETEATVGDTFAYVITVTNPGEAIWTGSLIDRLPQQTGFIKAEVKPDGAATVVEKDGNLSIYIQELKPEDKVEVEIEVSADAAGNVINTVSGQFTDISKNDPDENIKELTSDSEETKIKDPDDPKPPNVPQNPEEPEKSRPPVIDDIYEGDTEVSGKGIPDSIVIVTFPDGSTAETTVDENGNWRVKVPDGVYLKTGEKVTAIQIEPGKLASDETIEPVKPLPQKAKEKKDSGKANADSGDRTNIGYLLAVLFTALVVFIGVIIVRRRRRRLDVQ